MNVRTLFLIGILLELLGIFGLFLPHVTMLSTGTTIRLKSAPVDPYSLMQGTYVTLQYEVGEGLPAKWNDVTPVYVVLEKGKDDIYVRKEFTEAKPLLTPGQVCIRGQGWYGQLHFPDIAQYFVEEGLGKKLEEERNARRLFVDVVVNDDCDALIRNVILGPEVPVNHLNLNDGFVPDERIPEASAPVRSE